jgi:hypothetical protein
MNLVSLLILPAVISLQHNNGARYAVAAVALVVIGGGIAFSKRKVKSLAGPAGQPSIPAIGPQATGGPLSPALTVPAPESAAPTMPASPASSGTPPEAPVAPGPR